VFAAFSIEDSMKPLKITVVVLLFLVAAAAFAEDKPVYDLKPGTMWTREKDTGSMTVEDGAAYITHTGSKDFAVNLHENISVAPGDSFRISCKFQSEGTGTASFSIGMFDSNKKIITWSQGSVGIKGETKEKKLEQEFAIPFGGAFILPRIMGGGDIKVKVWDFKLEKLDAIALLQPEKELPPAGESFELVPATDTPFGKALQFKGLKEFVNQRGRIPWSKVDEGLRYKDKATWKIAASDGLYFRLMPLEPFKCSAGGKVFVSVRMYVERGRHSLAVYPWKGGMLGSEPIARGTFTPAEGEETGAWCCIHSYVTVPEDIDGLMPVIFSDTGGVYNITEWKIAVPSAEELSPKAKKVDGYFKERKDEVFDRGLTAIKTGNDVYLSWRLLKTDKDDTAFDVYRADVVDYNSGKALKQMRKVNQSPIKQTTDFIDRNVPDGDFRWMVYPVPLEPTTSKQTMMQSPPTAAMDKPYRSFKLKDGVNPLRALRLLI